MSFIEFKMLKIYTLVTVRAFECVWRMSFTHKLSPVVSRFLEPKLLCRLTNKPNPNINMVVLEFELYAYTNMSALSGYDLIAFSASHVI